jgi:hypothetical protein
MAFLLQTDRDRIGTNAYQVVETYSCPNNQLEATAAALWENIPSGQWDADNPPMCVKVRQRKNAYRRGEGQVPSGQIVAVYRTLTTDELMERDPPKGVVILTSRARGDKASVDSSGRTVIGVDSDDKTGRTVWKIVSGPSVALKPQTVYRVHACVNSKSMYIDAFVDKLGCLNSNMMTRLGQYGANDGELLFEQMSMQPTRFNRKLYWVDYDFRWSGEKGKTWDQLTLARKFERKAVQVPQLDTAGEEVDGGEKLVHTLVPTDDTRQVSLYTRYSFDRINRLCQW